MTICSIGYTRVKLHPGLLPVFILAFLAGMLGELLQAFLALTLHEAFHAITAWAMGYRLLSIEMLPFGGVARMEGQAVSTRAEFCIAMAGPLCNFMVAGALALAMQNWPVLAEPLRYFLTANLALALLNLLPALPLDGGRMLRAALLRVIRPRTATYITAWLGIACGGLLLGAGAYLITREAINPFLWIMGVFLVLGAVRELRELPQAGLSAMMRRRDSFFRGEALPARTVAVQSNITAASALRQLSSSRYTVLLVLDGDMSAVGQLDEGALMQGIARFGQDIRLSELLSRR